MSARVCSLKIASGMAQKRFLAFFMCYDPFAILILIFHVLASHHCCLFWQDESWIACSTSLHSTI